jgi:hypothetical protein
MRVLMCYNAGSPRHIKRKKIKFRAVWVMDLEREGEGNKVEIITCLSLYIQALETKR